MIMHKLEMSGSCQLQVHNESNMTAVLQVEQEKRRKMNNCGIQKLFLSFLEQGPKLQYWCACKHFTCGLDPLQ